MKYFIPGIAIIFFTLPCFGSAGIKVTPFTGYIWNAFQLEACLEADEPSTCKQMGSKPRYTTRELGQISNDPYEWRPLGVWSKSIIMSVFWAFAATHGFPVGVQKMSMRPMLVINEILATIGGILAISGINAIFGKNEYASFEARTISHKIRSCIGQGPIVIPASKEDMTALETALNLFF